MFDLIVAIFKATNHILSIFQNSINRLLKSTTSSDVYTPTRYVSLTLLIQCFCLDEQLQFFFNLISIASGTCARVYILLDLRLFSLRALFNINMLDGFLLVNKKNCKIKQLDMLHINAFIDENKNIFVITKNASIIFSFSSHIKNISPFFLDFRLFVLYSLKIS